MRTRIWAAPLLALALAGPAWAQSITFGNGPTQAQRALTGRGTPSLTPFPLINQPIDTRNSVVPIAQPQTLSLPGFNLSRFFPKVGMFSNRSTFAQSQFPTQSQLPGADWLRAFGFQRPQPVQFNR